MRVALVDDQKEFIQYEKKIIEEELLKHISDFSVDTYIDGEEFLKVCTTKFYDLIFLDIDLVVLSGFKVAEMIRKTKSKADIIFVSSHEHLVFNSLDYQPFHFIRKQFVKQELEKTITSLFVKYKKQNKYISIVSNGKEYKIKIDEIIYFEINRHTLIVNMLDGKHSFYGKISDKEEELKNFYFVRVHNGYLVNLKYVVGVGKGVLQLSNNIELPISRKKIDIIKTRFHHYLCDQV